jgi:hypothetical protein
MPAAASLGVRPGTARVFYGRIVVAGASLIDEFGWSRAALVLLAFARPPAPTALA